MKRIVIFLVGLLVFLAISSFFAWRFLEKKAFEGVASSSNVQREFVISKGEGSTEVGINLEKEGLIENKYYFYYYVWKTGTDTKLQAGVYEVAPNMTHAQMVEKFTGGDVKVEILKLTVPEGFTNKKIVDLVREKKPSIADEFEQIVNCKCLNNASCACDRFSGKYDFIKEIPAGVDMEGYLFPDTYFIDEKETGATLVSKFLNNFQQKYDDNFLAEAKRKNRTTHEIITMASVIEREANNDDDRDIVAGIFWNRIEDSHPLQSCATLAYFLGVDKKQFSYEDTRIESPYNTYLNPGLPPGPIANPGLSSIHAAVFPDETDYYYFLSNPETGEMFYARTVDEHNQNKVNNGL